MIEIKNREVYSTEGKLVHRIGTDNYFKRAIVGNSVSVEEFEEVEEMPKYTQGEYSAKVEELIRIKYTLSDELAILRQREEKQDEYRIYFAYAEECKIKAKEILKNKNDEEVVE